MNDRSVRFVETPTFQAEGETTRLFATSDGRTVFWFVHAGGRAISAVVDGRPGAPADSMAIDGDRDIALLWDEGGRHVRLVGSP
jgi:hypothetical protein